MTLLASMDWIAAGAGLAAGLAIGYGWKLWRERARCRAAAGKADEILCSAQQKAAAMCEEARTEMARLRRETETALAEEKKTLEESRQRLVEREKLVNDQLTGMARREELLQREQAELSRQRAELAKREHRLDELELTRRQRLAEIANLTEEEARARLLEEVEKQSRKDAADLSRHILDEARAEAETEARRIIATAMQRYAATQRYELTTASVALNGTPDIKGRIIGRDGRNIRAFEAATGVTVLIDDTPGTVILSGFDPVRREIARRSMEILISDGRIHPTRIEEVVKQVEQDIDKAVREAADQAVYELGLHPLHDEAAMVLGRLRFRHSYSQNLLDHSIEVAHLAGLMAAEMGANIQVARRAGLLHDIGKALNHELEGSHALIGADFLKQHGETAEVVNAVAAHHDEVPPESLVAVLVSVADALSASRPGARSESMTHYLKRLENLERIGRSFPGVEKCYAVQAGRELRVLVSPEALTDEEAEVLARRIVRKIEEELQYPGQIRVTVVREKRITQFAK